MDDKDFRPGFTSPGTATIPGPQPPRHLKRTEDVQPIFTSGRIGFVRLLKDATIGDRRCAAGEVIRVSEPPRDAMGRTMAMNIMPPLPLLFEDRWRWLIEHRFAAPSSGPATHTLGHSLDLEGSLASLASQVEAAMLPQPKSAGRAVGQPQRSGAI